VYNHAHSRAALARKIDKIMAGFENLTPLVLCWIAAVILVAGFMQGALGLGFPTVATPLIAIATDIRTAVIVVLLPCLGTLVLVLFRAPHLREALRRFWAMPLCAFAGAAVGTRLFVAYPGFPYALLLAGVIVVYLNLDRLGRAEWPVVRRHPLAFGLVSGIAAGLSEGTANVAAPPLVVYYLALGLQPTLLVQSLNICFLTGKTTQFATLATAGGIPPVQWLATLPLIALSTAGTYYGMRLRDRLDAVTYRKWLKGALFAIAVLLVGQYALGK
jgi:uncharacterized membrane protein YfcA